jgi:hypothetical protein
MSPRLHFVLAALLSSAQIAFGTYSLVTDYSGQNFFDSWTYFGAYDNLTQGMPANLFLDHVSLAAGDVIWVNSTVAQNNPSLTYVNGAGNAIVKVSSWMIQRNDIDTILPG